MILRALALSQAYIWLASVLYVMLQSIIGLESVRVELGWNFKSKGRGQWIATNHEMFFFVLLEF